MFARLILPFLLRELNGDCFAAHIRPTDKAWTPCLSGTTTVSEKSIDDS
jgi:hypothetical protein